MEKLLNIRTTKFPYFFWSFNKSLKCKINFSDFIYKNLELNNQFAFKPFNFYLFLILKYAPIFIIFYFVFNQYDFYFNTRNIIAYMLSFILLLSINFLENLLRKVLIIFLFIIGILISFYINDFFLIPYTFKYFILFSIFLLIYIDFKYRIFSIYNEENKIISHFMIMKNQIKDI